MLYFSSQISRTCCLWNSLIKLQCILWLRNQMQNTLRLHSSWTFHGKVPPEKPSQSVEKANEYCLLVCNMIAPESGAQLYEGLTFQRGDGALFGSRSADDGQQKCQDLGAQDTYPQYLRIQVSNSRTNEASRTARKVHPLASGASKKTCETAWCCNHSRKGAIL